MAVIILQNGLERNKEFCHIILWNRFKLVVCPSRFFRKGSGHKSRFKCVEMGLVNGHETV